MTPNETWPSVARLVAAAATAIETQPMSKPPAVGRSPSTGSTTRIALGSPIAHQLPARDGRTRCRRAPRGARAPRSPRAASIGAGGHGGRGASGVAEVRRDGVVDPRRDIEGQVVRIHAGQVADGDRGLVDAGCTARPAGSARTRPPAARPRSTRSLRSSSASRRRRSPARSASGSPGGDEQRLLVRAGDVGVARGCPRRAPPCRRPSLRAARCRTTPGRAPARRTPSRP